MVEDSVRVLVAEDDEDIRHLVRRLLAFAQVDVRTAVDGAQALQVLEADPVHCVVLDVRMPVLSGIEVLRAVRDRGLDVPVVMLTASVEAHVEQAALDLGAATVLLKPFEARDLLGAVARAVRSRHPALPLPSRLTRALDG
jgi:DNA-binding response OmpR family regulator